MGKTYLLDSNIIIYLLNGTLSAEDSPSVSKAMNSPANLSVITKIEILGWPALTGSRKEKMTTFIEDSNLHGLSEEVVEKSIELRRKTKIKLPDAIIAATALVYGHIILTRNTSDFAKINSLQVINPFEEQS